MAKKRKRQRGRRGEGYVTWDASRERWRCVVGPKSKYFLDEASARAQQRQWVEEARRPIGETPPDRVAIADALLAMLDSQDWLADSTRALRMNYIGHITRHIGLKAVGDLTPADVETFDRAMRRQFVGDRASHILSTLAALYRRLAALRVLTYDPVATYLTLTPARARAGVPLQDAQTLDAGLLRRVLVEMDEYQAFIAWLMVLGLRAGEARGVRWANVRGDTVAIVEQRRPGQRHEAAPIKTEREIGRGRVLYLPPALLALTPRDGDDLVFCHPRDSGSVDDGVVRRAFHAACRRARVPEVRMHDLRHSCATGLMMLGASETIVSAQLGHRKRTQTQQYIEVTPAMLRPWVEQWAGLVLGETAQLDKLAL
jgi:integrase